MKYYDFVPDSRGSARDKFKQELSELLLKEKLKEVYQEILGGLGLELRKIVEGNIYFAGGCFRSLILNEKINDYDVYFKNAGDVEKFRDIIERYKYEVLNEPFSDRDKLKYEWSRETERSVTFTTRETIGGQTKIKDAIQFITKKEFNGEPLSVVNRFDFQHTMAYYIPDTDELYLPKETSEAIATKTLLYNSDNISPALSVIRMVKFVQQGWKVSGYDLMDITLAAAKDSEANIERARLQITDEY